MRGYAEAPALWGLVLVWVDIVIARHEYGKKCERI